MALQKITTDIIADNAVTGSKISVAPVGQTPAAGDVLYYDGTDYVRLSIGSTDEVLRSTGSVPNWAAGSGGGGGGNGTVIGDAWIVGGIQGGVGNGSILSYAFASSTDSVVGSLSRAFQLSGANSSNIECFISGGHSPNIPDKSVQFPDTIEKFTYVSGNVAINSHGNLDRNRFDTTQGVNSATHGYVIGGRGYLVTGALSGVIKFPFANSGVTTTGVHSLSAPTFVVAGHENATNGYTFAGREIRGASNTGQVTVDSINQFSFANDTTRNNHGTLSLARENHTATGNTTHAYIGGGTNSATTGTTNNTSIEQVTLASANTTANHGDLEVYKSSCISASTGTHGLFIGGTELSGADSITKFAFAYASNVTTFNVSDFTITVQGSCASGQVPAF